MDRNEGRFLVRTYRYYLLSDEHTFSILSDVILSEAQHRGSLGDVITGGTRELQRGREVSITGRTVMGTCQHLALTALASQPRKTFKSTLSQSNLNYYTKPL